LDRAHLSALGGVHSPWTGVRDTSFHTTSTGLQLVKFVKFGEDVLRHRAPNVASPMAEKNSSRKEMSAPTTWKRLFKNLVISRASLEECDFRRRLR
jgi:hypothetical protein